MLGDGRAEGSSTVGDEGKLQFHSGLMLMELMFTSLKVRNLKVRRKGTYCSPKAEVLQALSQTTMQ